MELFREDGCMTDAGFRAMMDGQLDELGRLAAAEHLSYCLLYTSDVYKRQTETCGDGLLNYAQAEPHIRALGKPDGHCAVSYTHLDVYKRQV